MCKIIIAISSILIFNDLEVRFLVILKVIYLIILHLENITCFFQRYLLKMIRYFFRLSCVINFNFPEFTNKRRALVAANAC